MTAASASISSGGRIPAVTGIAMLIMITIGTQFATVTIVYYLFDEQTRENKIEETKQQRDNERDNRIQELILSNQQIVKAGNDKIIENSDRNFQAVINASIKGEQDRARQGNASLAFFLPLILDTDEDIEQIKRHLNMTKEDPKDLLKVDYNGTHVTINNNENTTFKVPIYAQAVK